MPIDQQKRKRKPDFSDQPKLLDLCCGAGAASKGYSEAGFEVIGVDILDQQRYPFELHVADVMELDLAQIVEWEAIDAIHASPPCQSYSANTRHLAYPKPRLIEPLREILNKLGVPWVIENVPGAPLYPEQTIMLCGTMFGKRIYRHRLFESNVPLTTHHLKCDHREPSENLFNTNRRGRGWLGELFDGEENCWMTQNEARQCVPPYFTEYIGLQLAEHLIGEEVLQQSA
jgi:DNA (cytosine-5)-methyltransferase 1